MTPATDDERAIAQAAELSRSLDELQALLLRAIRTEDATTARRILAGPLGIAACGTLERLRSESPA